MLTPLHVAAKGGHTTVIGALVDAVPRDRIKSYLDALVLAGGAAHADASDSPDVGLSALELAYDAGHAAAAGILVELGAHIAVDDVSRPCFHVWYYSQSCQLCSTTAPFFRMRWGLARC